MACWLKEGEIPMAYTEGSRLILNDREMDAFLQRVNRPDPDAIRRRDELFAMLDQMDLTENEDGSFEFEFSLKSAAEETTRVREMLGVMFANVYLPSKEASEMLTSNNADLLAA